MALGGRWAAKGRVIEPLFAKLIRHPFFKRKPPKSAGREQFGEDYLKSFLEAGHGLPQEDLLRLHNGADSTHDFRID